MSRKTSKRIVLYQKFIDASNKISDPSWKEVFKKLAYGRPLRGFVITERTLTFRKKKKTIDTIQIPEVLDSEKILEIKNFISRYSSFRSAIDLEKEKEIKEKIDRGERLSKMEWKQLKKNKKLLQMLELQLIEREKEQRKLNKKEVENLRKMINLGFSIDAFDGFKFDEEDRVISLIGLEFDEEEKAYYFNSERLNIFLPEKVSRTNSNSQESSENSEFLLTPECLKVKKTNIMKSWNPKKSRDLDENGKNGDSEVSNQSEALEKAESLESGYRSDIRFQVQTENIEADEFSSEI